MFVPIFEAMSHMTSVLVSKIHFKNLVYKAVLLKNGLNTAKKYFTELLYILRYPFIFINPLLASMSFFLFFFRSDYANGTFAVFFFPREWRHCLFHTFSLKTSFCRDKGTSCVTEWLECLTAYHRPRVRLPAEVRMRKLEEYVD